MITHYAATADVVGAIKQGLEQDGLGDLVLEVASDDPVASGKTERKLVRRPDFKSTEIYLPKVLSLIGGA